MGTACGRFQNWPLERILDRQSQSTHADHFLLNRHHRLSTPSHLRNRDSHSARGVGIGWQRYFECTVEKDTWVSPVSVPGFQVGVPGFRRFSK